MCCVCQFTCPSPPPSFPNLEIWSIPLPKPYFLPVTCFSPDASADRGDPHPRGEADRAAKAATWPVVFLFPGTQGQSGKALWGYNTGRLRLSSLLTFSVSFTVFIIDEFFSCRMSQNSRGTAWNFWGSRGEDMACFWWPSNTCYIGVLRLEWLSEPLGRLVKTQIAGPQLQSF